MFSAKIAALQYGDSESDEEDDDEDMEEVDTASDPLWRLYNSVRNFTTERGVEIGEAFVHLPSKRELPDYYQTISNPISLSVIKKKIRTGDYSTIQQLAADLELMFNNCKTYNRPESKLWKDANKLDKVMTNKLHEIVDGVGPEEIIDDLTIKFD